MKDKPRRFDPPALGVRIRSGARDATKDPDWRPAGEFPARPSRDHLRAIHLARSFVAPTASDRATPQRANFSSAGIVSCGPRLLPQHSLRSTIHCDAMFA
jgi:hypothetical protein